MNYILDVLDLDETPEDIEKMLIKKKRRKIGKNKKKERRKELKCGGCI